MTRWKKSIASVAFAAVTVLFATTSNAAADQTYEFQIQTAVPSSSLYFKLLQDFADQLKAMSDGRLKAEVLPAGAVVKPFNILDAVNHGVVKAGYAWPHYWSGKNSAYVLFSNVPASTGLDQRSLMAWYERGGGKALYRKLDQDIMGLNVTPFLVQPMGPDPLGWFKNPIHSMNEFKNQKYRAPPGIAGQTYKEMGIPAVSMPGGDIVPSAKRGVIDAAEWIGPADDRNLGLQKIWKNYYLQGLHQQTDIGELDFNKDFFDNLPDDLKAIIRVAIKANMTETYNADIYNNAKALREFKNKDNINVRDTPKAYYKQFIKAEDKVTKKFASNNPFFKKVLESQTEFAELVYPYRSRVLTLYNNVLDKAHAQRQQRR